MRCCDCTFQAIPHLLKICYSHEAKLRERFLGIAFWEHIPVLLKRERDAMSDTMKERDRAAEERRLLIERKRRIRSELGLFNYCFDTRRREYLESAYPKPKVYLSENKEIVVKMESEM